MIIDYFPPVVGERLPVSAFGAKGNGTSDDTLAIQAAINTANNLGGAEVFFGPGNYFVATGLTGAAGVSLRGSGRNASALTFADVAQVGINYAGAATASTTLAADAAEWTNAITVTSGAGFAVGQHILIAEGGGAGPSFFTRISAVAGTAITLEEPIPCQFLAANTPVVNVYNATGAVMEGVAVQGLSFLNASATPTNRQFFLKFSHNLDCVVQDCAFKGLGAASASGCYMQNGRGGRIFGCLFDNINNGGSALAAVLDSITAGDLSNNVFRNVSSAAILTRSPYSTMIGNRAIGNATGGRAFKALAGSNYSTIVGNIGSSFLGAGFHTIHMTDCWGCTVIGNSVANSAQTGINLSGVLATRTLDNVVVGNTIRQVQAGGRSIDTSGVNGPNYVGANDTATIRAAYKATADFGAAFSGVVDLGTQAAPFTIPSTQDVSTARVVKINISSAGQLTIQGFASGLMGPGELLTFDITNSSAGAITVAWSGSYHQVYTPPATGKRNQVTFRYDGAAWIQAFAQGPDV